MLQLTVSIPGLDVKKTAAELISSGLFKTGTPERGEEGNLLLYGRNKMVTLQMSASGKLNLYISKGRDLAEAADLLEAISAHLYDGKGNLLSGVLRHMQSGGSSRLYPPSTIVSSGVGTVEGAIPLDAYVPVANVAGYGTQLGTIVGSVIGTIIAGERTVLVTTPVELGTVVGAVEPISREDHR